jgi:hypothetical protein
MKYPFEAIDIFAFDFHVATAPLHKPVLLRKDSRFLVNPSRYQKLHSDGKEFELGNFRVRPLTEGELKHNHFWKHFSAIRHKGELDFWRLQAPFVFIPKDKKIQLVIEGDKFKATVRTSIYAFSVGWSTNVEISLSGSVEPEELVKFIGKLRSEDSFLVDGHSKNLSKTFGELSQQFRATVFVAPDQQVDSITTKRNIVISLSNVRGPGHKYASEQGLSDIRMSDGDRALMHSILLGRSVSIAELAVKENGKRFLLTRYSDPDFALTYFGYGTLLFLQKPRRRRKRNTWGCAASNTRSCSMISYGLLDFLKATEKSLSSNRKIQDLRQAINTTLHDLPIYYNNAFCKTLYLKHANLQDLGAEQP